MSRTATIAPTSGRRRRADPGLIGLLGFILATLTAQLGHLGLQEQAPTFWIGAAFGGLMQVIAGMLSYGEGDDFHFLVYNAFGFYWIVVPGFLLGAELNLLEVTDAARGLLALAFAILAVMFVPSGSVHNTVLPLTLIAVALGLGLESVTSFGGPEALAVMGAWSLVVASALAGYMLVEKFYWLTLGRRFLPLGPSWIDRAADPES